MPTYTCIVCGMGFDHADSLAWHMHFHLGGRPLLAVSRHDFILRPSLNRHTQRFHNHQDDEFTSGAQATTHTQHTESLHGIANTVATVNSSLGTAIVTIVRSTTPLTAPLTAPLTTPLTTPLFTTTVSQASGTVTVTHLDLKRDYGNECPICFDSLNDGETITTPCCSAKYHIACLRKLDQLSSTGFFCPNCRGELTSDWLSKTPEK